MDPEWLWSLSESRAPVRAWIAHRSRALLACYALFLVVILFSPTSTVQSSLVEDLVHALQLVVPDTLVNFKRVEVLMNVVIIAPLVFLASLVWPRLLWQEWAAFGLVGATAVELLQGLLLPDRSASFRDIVANATGAAVGALMASWLMPTADIETPR